nr:Gag-Pol polyprotein [Tanacetum cinerariifolium]
MGERNADLPKRPQNSNYFKEKMLLMQAQEKGVDFDEERLLFLVDGQTNTFDDELDKGPIQNMAQNEDNIFQADQFYDESSPSYDFDTLSEVQDHDNCLNNMNECHEEEHKIHNDVQPNDVGDSVTEYTSNSNIMSYEQDVNGVNLMKCNRGTNLYTSSVEYMMNSSPIFLLSKASKKKSWLWYHQLNHLNFDTISDLAKKDLVRGLPRLKFEKDHLCSACQLGKSQKYSHKPKSENTNFEVLNTLHMYLCGSMRVQTINEKKYILVIIGDYSRGVE